MSVSRQPRRVSALTLFAQVRKGGLREVKSQLASVTGRWEPGWSLSCAPLQHSAAPPASRRVSASSNRCGLSSLLVSLTSRGPRHSMKRVLDLMLSLALPHPPNSDPVKITCFLQFLTHVPNARSLAPAPSGNSPLGSAEPPFFPGPGASTRFPAG